ncbi:MAG: hypothetical protein HY674_05330 [Chloroflexi bacterium]|nr:hypothetical protein [Chloroflexota bacterium]
MDCGDRVREVTALALGAIPALDLTPGPATLPQSGDSEDAVAPTEVHGPNARPKLEVEALHE